MTNAAIDYLTSEYKFYARNQENVAKKVALGIMSDDTWTVWTNARNKVMFYTLENLLMNEITPESLNNEIEEIEMGLFVADEVEGYEYENEFEAKTTQSALREYVSILKVALNRF